MEEERGDEEITNGGDDDEEDGSMKHSNLDRMTPCLYDSLQEDTNIIDHPISHPRRRMTSIFMLILLG